jgi:PIN domain nuclease of toxin-antitoxin system
MTFLLDTHILIWSLFEPKKLKKNARSAIMDPANVISVSAVSLWEISLKYSIGKLDLQGIVPDEIPDAIRQSGFSILPLEEGAASGYYRLPKLSHRDPFDRMLICQAIHLRLTFITDDQQARDYLPHGLIIF